MKLLSRAILKYIVGLIAVCLVLFWPAGTLLYWNGWLFIGLLFIPMLIFGMVLFIKCPKLLEKRLNMKETQAEQKAVIAYSALIYLACFLCAGFDFRYGWTHVPFPVVVAAAVFFVVGYWLYVEVMRENAYLSRTVEIQENQTVIDTGLYGIVRHPMYFAVLLLFLSAPVLLGSWIALACMIPLPLILALRIKNEEAVLKAGLAGYEEYSRRVRYRPFPFLW